MTRSKTAALKDEIQLQPHQQRVVDRVRDGQNRLLLYHGLGSGKSLSSLAAAEALGGDYTAAVPASLRQNYQKEIAKFTQGSNPEVMSYTGLGMGKQPEKAPNTVIYDEAQRLSNPDSAAAQAATNLASQADNLLLLSGTPITNSPADLAPLLSMLHKRPMSRKWFEDRFVDRQTVGPGIINRLRGRTAGEELGVKNEKELRRLLRGYVDYQPSKTPEGVEVDEQTIEVPLSSKQNKIQRAIRQKIPPEWRWKLDKEFPLSRKELAKLDSFMTGYRQSSLSTQPFRGDKNTLQAFEDSSKLQRAYADLRETLDSDPRRKALIYSNFVGAGLDPYAAKLKADGIPYGVFHGGIPLKQRRQALKDYDSGALRALLLGPAAAEGISTKGTSMIQLLDPHWHESRLRQARGRGLRFDSHAGLPDDLKSVAVRRYLSVSEDPSLVRRLLGARRERTGDEILQSLTARKEKANDLFRRIVQEEGQAEEKTSSEAPVETPYWVKPLVGAAVGGFLGHLTDRRPPAATASPEKHVAHMRSTGLDPNNDQDRHLYVQQVLNRGSSPAWTGARVGGLLGAVVGRLPSNRAPKPLDPEDVPEKANLLSVLPEGYAGDAQQLAAKYRQSDEGKNIPFLQSLDNHALAQKSPVRLATPADGFDAGTMGSYEAKKNLILLRDDSRIDPAGVLSHELTHATQSPYNRQVTTAFGSRKPERVPGLDATIGPHVDYATSPFVSHTPTREFFDSPAGQRIGGSAKTREYLSGMDELEAYLANIKRDHFRDTGEHVTTSEQAVEAMRQNAGRRSTGHVRPQLEEILRDVFGSSRNRNDPAVKKWLQELGKIMPGLVRSGQEDSGFKQATDKPMKFDPKSLILPVALAAGGGLASHLIDSRPPARDASVESHLRHMKRRGLDASKKKDVEVYRRSVAERGFSPVWTGMLGGAMLGGALEAAGIRSGAKKHVNSAISRVLSRFGQAPSRQSPHYRPGHGAYEVEDKDQIGPRRLLDTLPAGYAGEAQRHAAAYRESLEGSKTPFHQSISNAALTNEIPSRETDMSLKRLVYGFSPRGLYSPLSNSITFDKDRADFGRDMDRDTVGHELTHAAQNPVNYYTVDEKGNKFQPTVPGLDSSVPPLTAFEASQDYSVFGEGMPEAAVRYIQTPSAQQNLRKSTGSTAFKHLLSRHELEAYLPNLKRQYFRATGQHITNPEEARAALQYAASHSMGRGPGRFPLDAFLEAVVKDKTPKDMKAREDWLQEVSRILPGLVRNDNEPATAKTAFAISPQTQGAQQMMPPGDLAAAGGGFPFRQSPHYAMNRPYRSLNFQPNPFGAGRSSRVPATAAGVQQATAKMGSVSRTFFSRLLSEGRSLDEIAGVIKQAAEIDTDTGLQLQQDFLKLASFLGTAGDFLGAVKKPLMSAGSSAVSGVRNFGSNVFRGSRFKPSAGEMGQAAAKSNVYKAAPTATPWHAAQTTVSDMATHARPAASNMTSNMTSQAHRNWAQNAMPAAAKPGWRARMQPLKQYGTHALSNATLASSAPVPGNYDEDATWGTMMRNAAVGAAGGVAGRRAFGQRIMSPVSSVALRAGGGAGTGASAAYTGTRLSDPNYNPTFMNGTDPDFEPQRAALRAELARRQNQGALVGMGVGATARPVAAATRMARQGLRSAGQFFRGGRKVAPRVSGATGNFAPMADDAAAAAGTTAGSAAGGAASAASNVAANAAPQGRGLYPAINTAIGATVAAPVAYQAAKFDQDRFADRLGSSAASNILNDERVAPGVEALQSVSSGLNGFNDLSKMWGNNKDWLAPLLGQMAVGGAGGYLMDGSRGAAMGMMGVPAAVQGAQMLSPETLGNPAILGLLQALGLSNPTGAAPGGGVDQRALQERAQAEVNGDPAAEGA